MLSFTLYSCQKDEFIEESEMESHSENDFDFKFKNKTFAELNKESKFKKAYQKFFDKKVGNANFEGRMVMEDQYGFTIDSSLIKEISSDNYTSYTFLIHRDSASDATFENLVVTLDSLENASAYIVKYNLNSEPVYIIEDDAYSLDAQIELRPIEYNNQNSDQRVYYDSLGCVHTLMCPYKGAHAAGSGCIAEDRGDLYWETNCSLGLGGSSDSSPDDGNPSSPPLDSGGGSGTSGGTPSDGGVDPDVPDSCRLCGGVITAPVVDFEPPADQDDPCDKIAEQINNPNFATKVSNLRNNFNLNNETGFSQTIDGVFSDLSLLGNNSLDIPDPIPNDWLGCAHVHQNNYEVPDLNNDGIPDLKETIKIFSDTDILTFIDLLNNAEQNSIPIIDIYLSIYTSRRNYTLRFTGNIDNVPVAQVLLKVHFFRILLYARKEELSRKIIQQFSTK